MELSLLKILNIKIPNYNKSHQLNFDISRLNFLEAFVQKVNEHRLFSPPVVVELSFCTIVNDKSSFYTFMTAVSTNMKHL